ncbi:GNAT family N-acetyltransferase [Deinococcus taeanensis]|uniref:GNAT family N-acetyltransferase n=1 Tax=Deinococcus taeanensis TaxID=2737050 RepID=UPI001CDBB360|nr:GNAT family N-acetyltransferase [Deinococcus taeanensis]UBV41833.1 GNAT family N-acetyltransferase [Deinococcus taeanensis]
MPELVQPAGRYKASFLEAVREAQSSGSGLGDTLRFNVPDMQRDFPSFLAHLCRFAPGQPLPDGFVHSEYLWLVEGDTYLGRASVRHTLNDRLRQFGGHIGYEVRPSARRQGHATRILQLSLKRAHQLGIAQALLTCDADNTGSRRAIEKNAGVLEGEFRIDDHPKPFLRFWVPTHP